MYICAGEKYECHYNYKGVQEVCRSPVLPDVASVELPSTS